jgi:hypothetical protein
LQFSLQAASPETFGYTLELPQNMSGESEDNRETSCIRIASGGEIRPGHSRIGSSNGGRYTTSFGLFNDAVTNTDIVTY